MDVQRGSQTVQLLRRMGAGDAGAGEEVLSLVYKELHDIARRLMDRERPGHTLQTTALIHEAWVRLSGAETSYNDRNHFLSVAARAMRRVLVDHARAKRTEKRGGERNAVPLDEALAFYEEQPLDLLALDEALDRLGAEDPELLRIVELRFFAGLTLEETGNVLGLTVRQVHRSWSFARGWLRRESGGAGG